VDIRIERDKAIYRCILDGAVAEKNYLAISQSLMPLLMESYSHVILDARLAQGLTPGSVALFFTPLIRILLKGGGVVILGPPEAMRASLEQLGLQTRIPIATTETKSYEAILRMIPKRYSNAFFTLLLERGVATASQIQGLHGEYRRSEGAVPFGSLLIQKGFVTCRHLLQLLDETEHPERYKVVGEEEFSQDVNVPIPEGLEAESGPRNSPPVDLPSYSRGDQSLFAPASSEFHQPRLLGEILIEAGLITEEQLRTTIAEQRTRGDGSKIGDILVQNGLLRSSQLFNALDIQLSRRGKPQVGVSSVELRSEFVQASLLGEILLEMRLIEEKDLRIALTDQKNRPGTRIGTILEEMGVINTQSLLQALEYQANRRG
jgi:hypothetical protein